MRQRRVDVGVAQVWIDLDAIGATQVNLPVGFFVFLHGERKYLQSALPVQCLFVPHGFQYVRDGTGLPEDLMDTAQRQVVTVEYDGIDGFHAQNVASRVNNGNL